MTNTPMRALLCGVGGYGNTYTKFLFDSENADVTLVAAVDPFIAPDQREELNAHGVPIYAGLGECLDRHAVDAAFISSPIALHVDQTCLALERGCHVLCEKPLCGTVQDATRMLATRDATGRQVAIGYQLSYDPAIQAFKADIARGDYGAPVQLKTLIAHPRTFTYFGRNRWAGKIRDAEGRWVLDSPAHNAHAHYLHNMFYMLGSALDRSAMPAWVEGETYRANDIENYDTAFLRCQTQDGVEILFYTSHATLERVDLQFEFHFEDARAVLSPGAHQIEVQGKNGKLKSYTLDPSVSQWKIRSVVDSFRTGTPPACGIEAALSQTLCVNGLQDSAGTIRDFPEEMIQRQADRIAVQGLDRVLQDCYSRNILPSEDRIAWSRAGTRVSLEGYSHFPAGSES